MTSSKAIPMIDLGAQYARLRREIDLRVAEVLAGGRYILGPEVKELETALENFIGGGRALAVANGTDALTIPLMAKCIGPGDAVFVPAFTFLATAEVVALLGATPVFVDVDPVTWTMDPADLAAKLAHCRSQGTLQPRAVIPVDLFGRPADYGQFAPICEEAGLFLIADAAQSFGASSGEASVGRLAPVTTTSFYPSKSLSCYGDGGCIFTEDEALLEAMTAIARHGFLAGGEAHFIGLNSRLDTLQAAILLAKLTVFEEELAARARIAANYQDLLRQRLPDGLLQLPVPIAEGRSAWSVFSILTGRRDFLRDALAAQSIATAIHYPLPLHLQPAYAAFGGGEGSLPVSEDLAGRILALPMHAYLDEEAQVRICDCIAEALRSGPEPR
jgi:dTDP-4-amino-4,6-dideoxygalactose transaminase